MNQSIIIAIGAVGYVAILMFIGVLASRRVGNSTDYIVAGRKLPLGLCVFTVFATWFGSGTLIGAAGAAYSGGLGAVLANPFGSALCLLLAGIFYARIFRRLKLLTLPDLFRTRFGRYAEIIAALSIIPAYVGWVGSILVAFGTVLNVVGGFGLETAILAGAVITIAYTCYGGMWAVSLTDFFQALVIITGLLVLFPLILGDLGGWQALIENSPAGHFDIAPEQSFYGWIMFMQGLLVIGLGNIASQDLLQRVFSARDERVAQWSLYLSTVLYLTVAMIPVLIGIAGTIALPGLADPAAVLPAMGQAYLPALGMALFAGAMFSALMSSADGGMLAPASIFGNNVWRAVYPDVDESTNAEHQPCRSGRRRDPGSCDRAVLPERLSAHGEIVLDPDGQLVRADDGCRVLEKGERDGRGRRHAGRSGLLARARVLEPERGADTLARGIDGGGRQLAAVDNCLDTYSKS